MKYCYYYSIYTSPCELHLQISTTQSNKLAPMKDLFSISQLLLLSLFFAMCNVCTAYIHVQPTVYKNDFVNPCL